MTFVESGLMISVGAHALARNTTPDHSGTTIYRLELADKFPKRSRLSENSVVQEAGVGSRRIPRARP